MAVLMMQGKVGAKAIERAMLDMFKNLKYVELYGRTIPHIVQAENTKVGDVYPANRAVVGDITLFCVPHVAMVDPVHLSQTEVVLRPAKTSRGIKAHRAIAAICQVCASFFCCCCSLVPFLVFLVSQKGYGMCSPMNLLWFFPASVFACWS